MVFVVDKLVATTVLHTRAVFPPAPLCAKNEAANKPRFSGNDAKSLYHKYSSPKKYLFSAEERESFLSSMKDNYVPTTRCTHLSQSSRQNRITFGVGRWVVPLPPPHLLRPSSLEGQGAVAALSSHRHRDASLPFGRFLRQRDSGPRWES